MAYSFCGAGLLSLILVLFGDVLGTGSVGAYDSQRFLLVVVMGTLSVLALVTYALGGLSDSFSLAKIAFPTILLCSAFLFLAFPFRQGEYVWIESGMFALFFLATALVGRVLQGAGATMACVQVFLVSMAAACTVYGLSCINIYLFAVFHENSDFGRHIPYGFENIRYWSHVATWCLPLFPLAVLIGPLEHKRSWRLFVLTGAGLWWWVLIHSMGRGSLLGIAFGTFLAMSLLGKRALPWFKIFMHHLAVGIFLWLLLSVIIPSVLYDGESQFRTFHVGAAGRLPLLLEAWERSMQNFPFGMGPQSWLTERPLTEIYASSLKFGHPHNMYLLWAAEYGWILIVFLGLVVLQAIRFYWHTRSVCFRSPLTKNSNEKLLLLAAFTASVSAALFHAGVSAVFLAPGSMLVGLFVLIIFWALIAPIAPEKVTNDRDWKPSALKISITLLASALLCFSWLVWMHGVWHYYEDMRTDAGSYAEEVGRATYPRFWSHGNFPR
ncbi:MAG: O-antigen ligase family protein [Pseudomonadota bacterium]